MADGTTRVERERAAALEIVRNVYVGQGKIEVVPKFKVRSMDDIAALYTPGVSYLVKEILERPEALGELTWRDNAVAVVSDGTAVLGMGRAGPRAALPVMEGKASMFKLLVGIDAIPLCLDVSNADALVDVLAAAEPTFGGYNLEDVASPVCFEVMKKAEARLGVPIIHDDQYGTATVIAAGLMNAWKLLGREAARQTVVICGDGAAGTATVDMLLGLGVQDIRVVGLAGIITRGTQYKSPHRTWIAENTNPSNRSGNLADAMKCATAFVGLSVGGIVSSDMVRTMAAQPVVFSMANPVPEIMPEESHAAGAAIVATGRFDYPNQCNNVLAFPGLMRGALDTKAKRIPREVCLAAAKAIADEIAEADLRPDNILPTPMSATLYPAVAEATARKIVALGLARITPAPGAVAERTRLLRVMVAKRQEFFNGKA
jgi:malate dehydrogenase (oxaloacetate-decarboxylating)